MFHLVGKYIARFIAHAVGDHIIKWVAWFGKRYVSWLFLILLLFIGVSVVNNHVGRWADYLGVFAGLFVPFCLFAVSIVIFVWFVGARMIEPGKHDAVLSWAEDERDDQMDDQHDEGQPPEKSQDENDQPIAV
jgi:hypothetical protein